MLPAPASRKRTASRLQPPKRSKRGPECVKQVKKWVDPVRDAIDTTMGFTALDGLMMGTRCGTLDPGLVLHLQSRLGMSLAEVEQLLYRQSGLLGVSGISSDMRVLSADGSAAAQEAIELFICMNCVKSAPSRPRSVGSTGWSSPQGSAKTMRRCADAWAGSLSGSAFE